MGHSIITKFHSSPYIVENLYSAESTENKNLIPTTWLADKKLSTLENHQAVANLFKEKMGWSGILVGGETIGKESTMIWTVIE